MLKHSSLLLVLLALIAFAYFWLYDDAGLAELSYELDAAESSTKHNPENTDFAGTKPDNKNKKDTFVPVHSADIADKALVQGLVSNQLGHAISDMQIEISSTASALENKPIVTTHTDQTGRFLFGSILPGRDYRLEVLASAGYAGIMLDPFEVVLDMTAVEITLEEVETFSVNGMTVDANNSPVANFEFLIQNTDLAYPARKIVSDSSGFFQLSEFPTGNLQLSTVGDEHFQITGISLQSGKYADLNLMFDKGDYRIAGWVSDAFNSPTAQARVVLTAEFSHQAYRSSSYRFALTDNNGNFEFSNLGDHAHRIVIDAVGYETRVLNHQLQSLSDNLNIRLQRPSD